MISFLICFTICQKSSCTICKEFVDNWKQFKNESNCKEKLILYCQNFTNSDEKKICDDVIYRYHLFNRSLAINSNYQTCYDFNYCYSLNPIRFINTKKILSFIGEIFSFIFFKMILKIAINIITFKFLFVIPYLFRYVWHLICIPIEIYHNFTFENIGRILTITREIPFYFYFVIPIYLIFSFIAYDAFKISFYKTKSAIALSALFFIVMVVTSVISLTKYSSIPNILTDLFDYCFF